MVRGPRKHLKRLAAPRHWMLNKLGGIFAPRPRAGPHKLRECLPLVLILRNRLKYALTGREVVRIVNLRQVKVDGKVRTDAKYPAGLMDVVQIEKTADQFRLLYGLKGRFTLHRIDAEESKFKLCKVMKKWLGLKAIPFLSTHDGRTIRYPDPSLSPNDTVKVDVETGKIVDSVKLEVGNMCMATGGANIGRIGEIVSRERHLGSFDIISVKDGTGDIFSTRVGNIFVLGKGNVAMISLPRGKGVRATVTEDREKRIAKKAK